MRLKQGEGQTQKHNNIRLIVGPYTYSTAVAVSILSCKVYNSHNRKASGNVQPFPLQGVYMYHTYSCRDRTTASYFCFCISPRQKNYWYQEG